MGSEAVQFDRSLIGREYPGATFTVTREMVQQYCRLVRETHPLITDDEAARRAGYRGVIVPLPCFVWAGLGRVRRPSIGLEQGRSSLVANTSQELFALVTAGDTLDIKLRLHDVYAKTGRSGSMVFVVWEFAFYNQDGVLVARAKQSQALHGKG